MSTNVYANGNAVSGKATAGKVISAFPDVCMSPPSPPAGPVPVPYPASSFSKDLQNGSSGVKIGGKPLALKSQSYFKSSPLGNEAATKSFGAGVVSHQTTGKTYFAMWSMDVKAEGKNVCRHLDITTSNHGSPGNTPPMPEGEGMAVGVAGEVSTPKPKCECCGNDMHDGQLGPDGTTPAPVVSEDKWYCLDEEDEIYAALDALGPPPNKLNKRAVKLYDLEVDKLNDRYKALEKRKAAVAKARELNCGSLPEPPCNVYRATPPGSAEKIEKEWDVYRSDYLAKNGFPSGTKTNHRVPKTAGGCPGVDKPGGNGNLKHDSELTPECLALDNGPLTQAQDSASKIWEGRYAAGLV